VERRPQRRVVLEEEGGRGLRSLRRLDLVRILGFLEKKRSRQLTRVARWFIFRPKIAIWVHFGRSFNGGCLCILWKFGLFYGHLVHFTYFVYFVVIWYIFPVLVYCSKKNLATLQQAYSNGLHKSNHPTEAKVRLYIFKKVARAGWGASQEPILRLWNSQLQRQRCSRLERFSM
jgi:hypothetical protein